jgi:chemotaxis signal transduction protein
MPESTIQLGNAATATAAASVAAVRYAVFRRHRQFFGLSIEFVTEVLPGQPLTRVPRGHRDLLGVLSLRGEILPVISIDALLNLEPRPDDPTLPILVLRRRDLLAGLRVDAIQSVISLNAAEIQPHPAGHDTHFAGIWQFAGDTAITLTLLSGAKLLDALCHQTTSAFPSLQITN